MAATELIAEIKENIGFLQLNRPGKGNALSPSLLAEIHLALAAWQEKEAVRVVVISGGEGKAFSSGYDIAAIPTDLTTEAAEVLKRGNPLDLALDSIKAFPFPVIAMINGYCFGAGLNLALCCDIRIGADHIKAGMPPAKLGAVYHPEGLMQFAAVIGIARTREMFFTARTYQGAQLLEMGLVHQLVPAEALLETASQVARDIAGNAPLAVSGTKKIINMIEKHPPLSAEDRATADKLIFEAFNSDDLREGQTAFLEKRRAVFTGK